MDLLALLGIIIGLAAVVGGNYLEGGAIGALLNLPAALIVGGGTLGAVILQTPRGTLLLAVRMLRDVARPVPASAVLNMDQFVHWARVARRSGMLGLEDELDGLRDEFTRKGLALVIDGCEPDVIRHTLEMHSALRLDTDLAAATVYQSMGGYAPTIGILGAVLGLIHVMGNLDDPSALGAGIATAFVATIYGVGLANLILLPIADRLRAAAMQRDRQNLLVIEALLAIAQGEHPKSLEMRLEKAA